MNWNCRGLFNNNLHSLGFFLNIISTFNLDFVFLSETKAQVSFLEPFFNRLGLQGCTGMNSVNSKRGLFLCWSRRVAVSIMVVDVNFICCKIADMAGNEYFMLFVQGSPYLPHRDSTWNHITDLISKNPGRWILIGDFNQVENHDQKLGGSDILRGANNFREWKLHNRLIDIPFHGVDFTWTNNRKEKEAIYERLDKAFCNLQWRDNFPQAEVWNLPILISDHSPIILHPSGASSDKKKRQYRLDAWSLNHEEVNSIIEKQWSFQHQGSSAFILQRKIQNSLREIRKWCLNYKNSNRIDWRDINDRLTKHQSQIQSLNQADEDQNMRREITEELQEKTTYWRQRAKSRWDDHGDKTSKFFYRCVKRKKSRNGIRAIKDDSGNWISDKSSIHKHFVENFEQLFWKKPNTSEPISPNDPFLSCLPTHSEDHISYLNLPFSNQEIKAACFSSKPLKFPGPDGTPPIFFQKNWRLVGPDVIRSVNGFLSSGFLLKEKNKTFITLIPKKRQTTRIQRLQTYQPLQYFLQNHFQDACQQTEEYSWRCGRQIPECLHARQTNDGQLPHFS